MTPVAISRIERSLRCSGKNELELSIIDAGVESEDGASSDFPGVNGDMGEAFPRTTKMTRMPRRIRMGNLQINMLLVAVMSVGGRHKRV